MRFIENGPDIPDELLLAQDERKVVFFCGSGVSRARVELPDFKGLIREVLAKLSPAEDSNALRLFRQFEDSGYPSVDSIFSELEKDFPKETIHHEVAQALKRDPKTLDLSAHKIMLNLAKQGDTGVRLVTTNFDLLFEAAAPSVQSHTRTSLPLVKYNRGEWGIVHLHGAVNKAYTGATTDGFVLNSSEFGNAYLSQGWARDFVADILENYVAVFIGYSADDPPINYLLQGLKASPEPKHRAFAFQSGREDEVLTNWADKSVQGIPYEEGADHNSLWASLEAWSKRSRDPLKWQKSIFRLARKGPQKLKPHERGMLAHIVSTRQGALALSAYTPPLPASWLCVFDPAVRFAEPDSSREQFSKEDIFDPYEDYALDSDPSPKRKSSLDSSDGPITDYGERKVPPDVWDAFSLTKSDLNSLLDRQVPSLKGPLASEVPTLPTRLAALGDWLSKQPEDPITVWWCARQGGLHKSIVDDVISNIKRDEPKKLPSTLREAWSLTFESLRNAPHDRFALFQLKNEITQLGWSKRVVRTYIRALSPYIELDNLGPLKVPPQPGKKYDRRDLAHFDVKYPDSHSGIVVPEKYLELFLSEYVHLIENAIDLEYEVSTYLELNSLEREPDEDGSSGHSFGINAYVAIFVSNFERLATHNRATAKKLLEKISPSTPIMARIKLWLLSFEKLADTSQYSDYIANVDIRVFWDSSGRRDLLLGLKRRWHQLTNDQRKLIEKKIKKGDPSIRKILRCKESHHC